MKELKERLNSFDSIRAVVNRSEAYKYNPLEHVTISTHNSKMGRVASVSLPPVITCKHCRECQPYCYAVRSFNRMGNDNPWAKNYQIYKNDPKRYFDEINNACYTFRFFRWHVSGDIIDNFYFENIVTIACSNPYCEFLIFTKNYDVVNDFIRTFGDFPNNLHVVFSIAPLTPYSNPFNIPESHILFKDFSKNTFHGCAGNVYECNGTCEKCAYEKSGCFNLKRGDVVILPQH